MEITSCDGKLFADFLVAGTFFLRKYRSVVNDLNVFPVPDGDTGTNMFFTVRSAMVEARKERSLALNAVAAAAAQGSLMGARGNSGVIISQMFRGFAYAVRHREAINTIDFASALHEAVQAARKALLKPVEGTILSVAQAAADACFRQAVREKDFFNTLHATVAAANEALEKTPEQLAVLKEANVVDAGGQGFVYFMEGIVRMLPGRAPYTTAFPRSPVRRTTFTARQKVETHRFCTEFVLEKATTDTDAFRALLTPHGDSLIVAGGDGVIRVHIHTDYPDKVADMARDFGSVGRLKIDNMEDQHNVLVVDRDAKPRGIVAVVPGEGFAKIFKELGADVVVIGGATMNPSVKDLLVAVNKVLAPVVYLLPNDKNIMLAAGEVVELTDKRITVVPSRTVRWHRGDVRFAHQTRQSKRKPSGDAHGFESHRQRFDLPRWARRAGRRCRGRTQRVGRRSRSAQRSARASGGRSGCGCHRNRDGSSDRRHGCDAGDGVLRPGAQTQRGRRPGGPAQSGVPFGDDRSILRRPVELGLRHCD